MIKQGIVITLAAAVLLGGCSDDKGQTQKKKGTEQTVAKINKAFASRDANSDGKISHKEFIDFAKAQAQSKPPKIDADTNGVISMEEFTASKAKMQQRLQGEGVTDKEIAERIAKQYAALDINKDGSLATEEYVQRRAARTFRSKDSDKNKFLSETEFTAKPSSSPEAADSEAESVSE